MKHKVSELEGALLDAAVALAEGAKVATGLRLPFQRWQFPGGESVLVSAYRPSSEWWICRPIIKRNWRPITAKLLEWFGTKWRDGIDGTQRDVLRWFMRAYVANKLGEEVEL